MLRKNMSKKEIEKVLEGKGDFVQINYLTRFLEEKPALILKKFAYSKLSKLYQKKNMFNDAAKMLENIAEISITFSDKIKYFTEASELYIKAGRFENSDYALKKALHNANFQEKKDIYFTVKNFYKKQAQEHEQKNQRRNAVKIYEKLLDMKISDKEKSEIRNKLLDLYEKLGRFKEYNLLKKTQENI